MKNLNRLIFLLLTLALVSTPATVLSETWDQKLDLTIPSLEMPSTLPLDSKAKQEIMMGLTCCYHPSLVKQVQKEHLEKLIALRLKEKPSQLQFTPIEPISNIQWATFFTLQLADIYTTYRGLKYDCVYELNPLAGERPSVIKMIAIKTIVLAPAIESDLKRQTLSPQSMDNINFLMALVVGNNYHVWHGAERNCSKIS